MAPITVGIDLVHIPRMHALIIRKQQKLHRIFSPEEIPHAALPSAAHLAGIFAAKEASYKALSQGGYTLPPLWAWLRHTTIAHHPTGTPYVTCAIPEFTTLMRALQISISHEREYAIALALFQADIL